MYLDQKTPKRPRLRRETIKGQQLYCLRWNMCIFSHLFIAISNFRTPCMAKTYIVVVIYVLGSKYKKRPQLRRKTITGEQLYWLRSIMCTYSQLFIVFLFLGHPVGLKHTLNKLIIVFGSKGSQNAPAFKITNYGIATLLIEVKYVPF